MNGGSFKAIASFSQDRSTHWFYRSSVMTTRDTERILCHCSLLFNFNLFLLFHKICKIECFEENKNPPIPIVPFYLTTVFFPLFPLPCATSWFLHLFRFGVVLYLIVECSSRPSLGPQPPLPFVPFRPVPSTVQNAGVSETAPRLSETT